MKKNIAASLSLIVLLAACNFPGRSPTAVPTVAILPTFAPTMTSLPPTQTPDAVASLIPEGQPAPEWNEIPIMPGAVTGEGDEESYVFTIKATPQQVQEYYQDELGKLGWQPFATSNRGSSLMLMFTNDASAALTISILTKGDQVLVLLVK